VSVSPDGQSIAFERAAEVDTFGSLTDPEVWIVGRDGSGLRLLVEDAMAPAWSR
jgi:Tol biopolymer transport system component